MPRSIPPGRDGTGMTRARKLTARTPAKLNLSLRVVGRRSDGYHFLDSIMVPVSLFDELVIGAEPASRPVVTFSCSSADLAGDEDNLAVRAARVFLERSGASLAVSIHLEKGIPLGAGLGGGSSDAAAVLRALDRLSGTRIDAAMLARWGLDLGADVPFFVNGRPARVEGIGETITPLQGWPSWPLVVVFPGTGVSTAAVYREYDRSLTKPTSASTIPVSVIGETAFRELLVNDLEAAAIRIFPPLLALRQRLADSGAQRAAMTGSGSAMFGVWPDRARAESAAAQFRAEGLWAHTVEILSRTPELVEG